jgi:hypothetical protein
MQSRPAGREHANLYPGTLRLAHAYANSNRNSHGDSHTYFYNSAVTYSNGYGRGHGYVHAYIYGHLYADSNSNRYIHTNSDPDLPAELQLHRDNGRLHPGHNRYD